MIEQNGTTQVILLEGKSGVQSDSLPPFMCISYYIVASAVL